MHEYRDLRFWLKSRVYWEKNRHGNSKELWLANYMASYVLRELGGLGEVW